MLAKAEVSVRPLGSVRSSVSATGRRKHRLFVRCETVVKGPAWCRSFHGRGMKVDPKSSMARGRLEKRFVTRFKSKEEKSKSHQNNKTKFKTESHKSWKQLGRRGRLVTVGRCGRAWTALPVISRRASGIRR